MTEITFLMPAQKKKVQRGITNSSQYNNILKISHLDQTVSQNIKDPTLYKGRICTSRVSNAAKL